MADFREQELSCKVAFEGLGETFHLWTAENFELIFSNDEDFKVGMAIMGICTRMFENVRVLTFELMSNHIHVAAAASSEEILREFFEEFKNMLSRNWAQRGKSADWKNFKAGFRQLKSLNEVRNVIIYDNRNGYIAHPEHTPYTYPWGANRYYFNPDAVRLALKEAVNMPIRDRRTFSRSHVADKFENFLYFDGYLLPLSFCDIAVGESLFRSPSHYFAQLFKGVEKNQEIAREIGESQAYTDDELMLAISKLSMSKFKVASPSLVPIQGKLELAATMRYDYNAGDKQICRILRLDESLLKAIIRG